MPHPVLMARNAELELLADVAVGIEQQLIELVNRRDAVRRGGGRAPSALDAEIATLQEALGDLAERLSPV